MEFIAAPEINITQLCTETLANLCMEEGSVIRNKTEYDTYTTVSVGVEWTWQLRGIKAQMDFGPLKRRPLSLFPSIFLWLSSPSDFRPTTTANVVFPAEEIALSADKSERGGMFIRRLHLVNF